MNLYKDMALFEILSLTVGTLKDIQQNWNAIYFDIKLSKQ